MRPSSEAAGACDEIVSVIVSISDSHDFDEVVDQLRKGGLEVTGLLQSLRTVTGRATRNSLPVLRAIPGVAAVEIQREVQVPPPASDIQ